MKPDTVLYAKPDARAASRSRLSDALVLAKVRVNALVVATTAGGFYMASRDAVDLGTLAATCAGTALVAGGAAAINQVTERGTDKLMERTRQRPVADGRMSPTEGRLIALALAGAGIAVLLAGSNAVAAAVALATLFSYAAVYTPLKRRSSLSTVVGAVPGALPPLIGWAGAGGSLGTIEPWSLFILMFLWQLPHFLAIAWIYREDYARAGLPMLSVVDKQGALVGRQAALWAAALVAFSQLPFLLHLTDARYAIGAIVLGLAQFVLAFRFARHRSLINARVLFFGSIIYLPLLWMLMVIGRQ